MTDGKPMWTRSSRCSDNACVEVARIGREVAVRDSKNVDQPFLRFSRADWMTFIEKVATGDYRPL
jgi:hypothetical protein